MYNLIRPPFIPLTKVQKPMPTMYNDAGRSVVLNHISSRRYVQYGLAHVIVQPSKVASDCDHTGARGFVKFSTGNAVDHSSNGI